MSTNQDDHAPIRQLLIGLETAITAHDAVALHTMLTRVVDLDMSALSEGEPGARPCETVIHGWIEEHCSRPHQLHALRIGAETSAETRVAARGHAIRADEGFDREGSWEFTLRNEDDRWRIAGYRFTPDS